MPVNSEIVHRFASIIHILIGTAPQLRNQALLYLEGRHKKVPEWLELRRRFGSRTFPPHVSNAEKPACDCWRALGNLPPNKSRFSPWRVSHLQNF